MRILERNKEVLREYYLMIYNRPYLTIQQIKRSLMLKYNLNDKQYFYITSRLRYYLSLPSFQKLRAIRYKQVITSYSDYKRHPYKVFKLAVDVLGIGFDAVRKFYYNTFHKTPNHFDINDLLAKLK